MEKNTEMELEKLRNHNRELLGELKEAKAALSELQEKHSTTLADLDQLNASINERKVGDAWAEVVRNAGVRSDRTKFIEIAAEGLGIDFDDTGAYFTKDGEPMKDGDVVYRPSNEEHCYKVMAPVREAHPFLFNRPSGPAPAGNNGRNFHRTASAPAEPTASRGLGLR